MNITDVVVVGAGPVGLLAAIELSLGGVRVVVLERLPAPSTVVKALGIGALGSETLQRRGMGAAVAAAEASSFAAIRAFAERNGADLRERAKIGGHFAGLFLLRKDVQAEPARAFHPVDQQALEAMLAERALALGIEVRRGCDVTGFVERDDGIDVAWASATGDGRIGCRFLVGCDGGRSPVRKMAGFAFPGTPPTMTMLQAVAEIDHPERLGPIGWRHTPEGVFSHGPFPGRFFLLDFIGPPADRQAPVTRDEIESALRRISGADVRVTMLESAGRWTDNTRLVDSYRRGRIFLAGDAAHVHSPFGGQGLSLGLCDAANLGWKLAAVVRGAMPDALLDTYTAERRPVAEAVLANTLAQAAIMRPDPQSRAMRDVVAKLMRFDDANRFLGDMMNGLGTRYDLGSNRDDVGRLIGDRPIGGADAPDVGPSLYDLMHDGAGVLLDASTGQMASTIVEASTQAIRCVAVGAGPSLLVRPDACVAWACEDGGTDGLPEALARWFAPASDMDAGSHSRRCRAARA